MDPVRFNPYADFGSVITGSRFIGRESELRTIGARIFGTSGFGSIAVVGLPRIGKTSLVSEAIRRARSDAAGQNVVVARADVGAFDSVNELLRCFAEDLIEEMRVGKICSDLIQKRMNEILSKQEIDFGTVRSMFRSLRQVGIRPVCILDEFDAGRRVFKDTPRFFHWLRELCSNPEFKAAVVIVAKRRLQDISRLAGYESNYWANVLMTLPLNPIVAEIGRSVITPIKPEAGSGKIRHSRESGNPGVFVIEVDSRFRGNDRLKTTVSACGLSSLAVNLSHTLFRSENPVFCAVDVRMGRHFMQLSGKAIL